MESAECPKLRGFELCVSSSFSPPNKASVRFFRHLRETNGLGHVLLQQVGESLDCLVKGAGPFRQKGAFS